MWCGHVHLENWRWVNHTTITLTKATSSCGDGLLTHSKRVFGGWAIHRRTWLITQEVRYRHLGSLHLRHASRRSFGEGRLSAGGNSFWFEGALTGRSADLSWVEALWKFRSQFLIIFFWVISPSLQNWFGLPTRWRSSVVLESCQCVLAF